MFKILVAGIVLTMSLVATADQPVVSSKKIVCFPLKQLIKDIKEKYGEEPMILGITEYTTDIGMGVYVNRETGSYTVIEFDNEAGCIISVGQKIRYRFPKNALSPIS
jgi:hypothetical protein